MARKQKNSSPQTDQTSEPVETPALTETQVASIIKAEMAKVAEAIKNSIRTELAPELQQSIEKSVVETTQQRVLTELRTDRRAIDVNRDLILKYVRESYRDHITLTSDSAKDIVIARFQLSDAQWKEIAPSINDWLRKEKWKWRTHLFEICSSYFKQDNLRDENVRNALMTEPDFTHHARSLVNHIRKRVRPSVSEVARVKIIVREFMGTYTENVPTQTQTI